MRSWFYVHPALGLVEGSPGTFFQFAPEDWHPGGGAAQDDAEGQFLAVLIDFFAASATKFEADLPLPDDQTRLEAAAHLAGVPLDAPAKGVFVGRLDPGLAEAFPAKTQLVLSILEEGVERLYLHDDVRQTFVHLDEAEAIELRSLLERRGLLR